MESSSKLITESNMEELGRCCHGHSLQKADWSELENLLLIVLE